jgi:hypothetical protein
VRKLLIRFVLTYLLVAAFAAAALLVDTWPRYPRSVFAWILLLVIALPVTFFGDWLTDQALSTPMSILIDGRPRGVRLTWLRILYYLACYVLFGICTVTVLYWLQAVGALSTHRR